MTGINPSKFFAVKDGEVVSIKKITFDKGENTAEYDKNLFAMTKEFMQEAVTYMDKNSDKKVSVEEFQKGIGTMAAVFDPEKLDSIDQDKDGILSNKETAALLKWMDKNRDGTLDKGVKIGSRMMFTADKKFAAQIKSIFDSFEN